MFRIKNVEADVKCQAVKCQRACQICGCFFVSLENWAFNDDVADEDENVVDDDVTVYDVDDNDNNDNIFVCWLGEFDARSPLQYKIHTKKKTDTTPT